MRLLKWLHWIDSRDKWDWNEFLIDMILVGIMATITIGVLILKDVL